MPAPGDSQDRHMEVMVQTSHGLSVCGIVGLRIEELVHGLQLRAFGLVHFGPSLTESAYGEVVETAHYSQKSIVAMKLE